MPNFLSTILTIFQLIISFGTVCTLLYAFVKFSRQPQQSQNERIRTLEDRVAMLEMKQNDVYSHLESIDEGNKATQRALLALLGHAINGDDVEEVKKAQGMLLDYLTEG